MSKGYSRPVQTSATDRYRAGNSRHFCTFDGNQNASGKNFGLHAVAVRPGDVAASVPEPQTLALILLALGATVAARRRRSP